MAKCKVCRTEISNGLEYCENCSDKGKEKSNELYLDSLLNSVINTDNDEKKSEKKQVDTDQNYSSQAYSLKNNGEGTFQDNDFNQFSFDEDLSDFKLEDIYSDFDMVSEQIPDYFSGKNHIEEAVSEEDRNPNQSAIQEELASKVQPQVFEQEDQESFNEESIQNNLPSWEADNDKEPGLQAEEEENKTESSFSQWEEDMADIFRTNDVEEEQEKQSTPFDYPDMTNIKEEEIETFSMDKEPVDDLNALLNGLDFSIEESEVDRNENIVEEKVDDSEVSEESFYQEEDDFLSLLNQIAMDDPVSDDVKAINDLMNGVTVTEKPKEQDAMTDVGAVFSDALKAVSSLNDPNINEEELLGSIGSGKDKKGKKKDRKKKKAKIAEQDIEESIDKPKKESLFKRLFGNVKGVKEEPQVLEEEDDFLPTRRRVEEIPEEETDEKQKKTKKTKKIKKAKTKDVNPEGAEEGDDQSDQGKKKTKEKKPKKQKEIMQVIDEMDDEVGRINRLGASIVFLFFGLLALLLYLGSNTVNYAIAIEQATDYFDRQKYTQAYYEVYGVNIKAEDIQLYEKIQTVMFVNKELNSYNNYIAIKKYPQALDSLLKGLERYNKYIELSKMLGTKI